MKRGQHKRGFTLVELLTTLAVIGVLLALLVPALNQVGKMAANVKQKAQFHAIGTALEAFRNDYGDYPPSEWANGAYGNYFPSQRLAEALVGRDGLGFHPASQFVQSGLDTSGNPIYYPDFVPADAAEEQANLAARKGPYLEIESANAIKPSSIYPPGTAYGVLSAANSYVLVDMYKVTKNRTTGKQIGMPILYYKANKMKIGNDPANWATNTYNVMDNYNGNGFIAARSPANGATHPLKAEIDSGTATLFYGKIENPNFPGPPARPYRAESFLLHSAGPDGLYGTTDDVFNFDQDN